MTVTTARQRVFIYIQKRRAVSAAEIGRDLRMTQANARHHLSILQKNGQVEIVGQRGSGRQGGRPVKIYGLARGILGDGLPALSGHILNEWLDSASEREKTSRLENLAKRLANLPDPSPKSSDFGKAVSPLIRLTETVKRLNDLGYQSRWEAHADGPRIILGHCPYAAIIHEHPELCQMDASLLKESLAQHVTQIAKLEGEESGRPYCVFAVE